MYLIKLKPYWSRYLLLANIIRALALNRLQMPSSNICHGQNAKPNLNGLTLLTYTCIKTYGCFQLHISNSTININMINLFSPPRFEPRLPDSEAHGLSMDHQTSLILIFKTNFINVRQTQNNNQIKVL